MDLRKLADTAKRTLDERGGTERLKQDAERLRDIATGPGSARDKAKRASDALREPPARTGTEPPAQTGNEAPAGTGTQRPVDAQDQPTTG